MDNSYGVCVIDRCKRWVSSQSRQFRSLSDRGIRIEFMKEGLTFTGEDSPMAKLLLSVMGAFGEFERSLIRERQLEGIAIARSRGKCKGRKPALTQPF